MKYEVTKEQILEAHADACNEWKEKLEEWFPKVFEQKCEVGKWYWANEKAKRDKTFLFFNKGKNITYGFGWDENWSNNLNHSGHEITGIEATIEEIEEVFTRESIKRYGDYWSKLIIKTDLNGDGSCINDFSYNIGYSRDNIFWNKNGEIFYNGVWAELIEEPNPVEVSKSDIAKLMNVEVSNLKIVD